MTGKPPPYSALLEVAQQTAVAAGKEAHRLLAQPRKVFSKGFRDLVTDADVTAQNIITRHILEAFPDHGFLPEEKDSTLPTEGPVLWLIDPIDGTTNYSRGQPNYCVSVSAVLPLRADSGEITGYQPLAGAIYDPVRRELFSASLGAGAFLQDDHGRKPCLVSQIENVSEVMLLCDIPGPIDRRRQTMAIMNEMAPRVFTIRNLGSATLSLAWVAVGRADGYFNLNVRPWDLAAAHIILAEAGGTMTTIDNRPLNWLAPVMDCFASNGRSHPALLAIVGDIY